MLQLVSFQKNMVILLICHYFQMLVILEIKFFQQIQNLGKYLVVKTNSCHNQYVKSKSFLVKPSLGLALPLN